MSLSKRLSFETLEPRRLLAKDLAIVSVQLTNAIGEVTGQTPVIGEKVYAVVHYRTTDLTPGDMFNIRWTMDGVSTEQQGFTGFAGTNVDRFWYHGGWIAQAGMHSVTITVDSGNTVAEANEGNNSLASSSFTSLTPTSLPNKFIVPLAGTQNVDYVIGGYVDVNPKYYFEDPLDFYEDYQGNKNTTRDFHNGIDIGLANFAAQDAGVSVRAAAAGTVVEIRDGDFDRETVLQFDEPGNYVFISHGDGWVSQYYHLRRDSITVNVGDVVTAGQVLGLVGSSGNSAGPHVHFEVQHNKSPVDLYTAPSSYWVSPPPYVFDPALTNNPIYFGVTNDIYDGVHTIAGPPYEHLLEKVSDVDQFPTTAQEIYAYVAFPSVQAGDTWKAQLYRPNGTLVNNFGPVTFLEDRPTDGGWYRPGFTANIPGTWRVDFLYNDVKVAEKFFTVGASTPEIRVFDDHAGTNTYIIDGRQTPIDFGTVDFGDTGPTKTFTVENHGYANLTTSGVNLPAGYTITESLSATIAAGASDTFTVRLNTSVVGAKAGTIEILSNDSSEASFTFLVEGLVDGNDADFDNDGDVDGRDFLAWQRGYGITTGAMKANGDATGEGAVNGADLTVWQNQYNTPPTLVAALADAADSPANLFLDLAMFADEDSRENAALEPAVIGEVIAVDRAFGDLPLSPSSRVQMVRPVSSDDSLDDTSDETLSIVFDEFQEIL